MESRGPDSDGPEPAPAFDVVALVAPGGGVEALAAVLRHLPVDFPAPVVVLQHLFDQGRALASVLRRRIRLPVGWATEGQDLEPGQVLLCPPDSGLVVLPDGTVSIVAGMGPVDRPGDALLESLAESHAGRTLAVVLAGGGRDGAAGARAVRAAGGTVVAQGDDHTGRAGAPAPPAAVAAGAIDLVLPRDEIGPLVADLVGKGVRPAASSDEAAAMERVFVGGGPAAAALRTVDWASTSLGPVASWPASLAATVRTMLDSPLPVAAHWGPELVVLANDACRTLLGADLSDVVGRPLREAWPADWEHNRAVHLEVLETGRARVVEDAPVTVDRGHGRQEIYLTSALTPLRGDQGSLVGTLSTAMDTTEGVLGRRQLEVLRRLPAEVNGAVTIPDACRRAVSVLATDPGLLPFVLVYLFDGARTRAQLSASAGLAARHPAAPTTIALRTHQADADPAEGEDGETVWPVGAVAREGSPLVLADLADRLPGLIAGPYPEPPPAALVLPLRMAHDERAAGAIVLGLSARRPLDPSYRGFLDVVGAQVAAGMTDARARQQERGRLDALADLDRAKTDFFANVSHEFRTPLTLLLGPLEAALARRDALPDDVAGDLDIVHRSAVRMLRMVGALLDFSQIEAGRVRGSFEATDLSALTRDLVGVFLGAADQAGVALVLDCPPLPEPVWVDRLMWERVVANLLSNALKFTLEGQITVSLRLLPSHAELVVADTGSGIPEADLPHVFQRFHRVEGVAARTREGTGIGLALVHDLVRLHHGRVRVRSRLGQGSTFTVWVPRGRRLDGQPPAPGDRGGPGSLRIARTHADEARAWSSTPPTTVVRPGADAGDGPHPGLAPPGRVLVVDDNPDMRAYLRRLLGRHWTVDVARSAAEARERIAADPPDLVVTDVMMAEVDGLALLREMRDDPATRDLPVVLLSARAGEDEMLAGLEAGADDYIVKPFSSRELVARIGAQLELSRLRRQHDHAVRRGDERLRLALEASGYVAFEWDTTTNQVIFLGGDGRALYGMTGEHPSDQGGDIAELIDVVHEDDLTLHMASPNRTLTGDEPYADEYRIRLPDGGVRWIRSVARRRPDDPRRLFGVSMDVTDRRAADDRLHQATEQLIAEVEALTRFQALSNRLLTVAGLDPLLEEALDAVIELQGADGGTAARFHPGTADVEMVIRRDPDDGGDPDDSAHQPAGTLAWSTTVVDRSGSPVGVLTTHTGDPQPRSELERSLAELYVRQASALIAATTAADRQQMTPESSRSTDSSVPRQTPSSEPLT